MEGPTHSLLTADQVARLLNVKVSTVYDAASRGRLPCVRLWSGNRRSVVRFVAEDIDKMIRERSTGGSPTAPSSAESGA